MKMNVYKAYENYYINTHQYFIKYIASKFEIYGLEIDILSFIYQNEYTNHSMLCEALGQNKTKISRLIDRLEAKRQFDVNLFGLAEITKEVLPIMRNQQSGLIIDNSSMGGKMYTPLGAWYHATKHALEGFSDCLRMEAALYNINVVILEPGSVDSEWNGITVQHLENASKNTVYNNMVDGFINMYNSNVIKPSKPELIADTVNKIINKKKPKTRYLVGLMAKPMVFMRQIMTDRMFDKMWKMMYKY